MVIRHNACGRSDSTAVLGNPVAYIDEEGSVIIVGYEAYRRTSWIDGDDRTIPDSWKKLEVVHNNSFQRTGEKPPAANEPNEG